MQKKIKIVRIITRLNIGGPAVHTILLTSKIDNTKFQSYLLTGEVEKTESNMMYLADKYNVKPIVFPEISREIRPLRDIKSFFKIYRLLRIIKPDIVHTHTAKAGTIGRLAAFFSGVPIIIHTFHGNVFNGYFSKAKTKIFIIIEKLLAKLSTKIIAISKQQKNELVKYGVAFIEKIKIINLGFDFENVIPGPEHKRKFKSNFNFPADAKLVGIVGRLAPIKNHILFIDIAEQVINKYDNIYFPIIGDGEMRALLEDKVKERNLQNKIIFTGFIRDLKSVYADLDIVLLTSINEGTPVALIEAMACGKIVMTTKVGGVADFIVNGKNGFIFDTKDYEPFVREIENWLADKKSYEIIGEEAKKTAMKLFGAERLISDIERLYEQLLTYEEV